MRDEGNRIKVEPRRSARPRQSSRQEFSQPTPSPAPVAAPAVSGRTRNGVRVASASVLPPRLSRRRQKKNHAFFWTLVTLLACVATWLCYLLATQF